jgi:hypothetical protein
MGLEPFSFVHTMYLYGSYNFHSQKRFFSLYSTFRLVFKISTDTAYCDVITQVLNAMKNEFHFSFHLLFMLAFMLPL